MKKAKTPPENIRKKPGNPNWGKMNQGLPINPGFKCDFEKLVEDYQLTPDQWETSHPLKAWCQKYKNSKYVPEHLMKAWGFAAEFYLDLGD